MPEIILKKDAVNQGLKQYFTGNLCKSGHIAKRFTSGGGCVECDSVRSKKYYDKNKKAVLARQKEQRSQPEIREVNFEKDRARTKARREANPEKVKAEKKASYKVNSEKVKTANKVWKEANSEKVKARNKAYRKANPEGLNSSRKAYRDANPEKQAATRSKRRADKKNATPLWYDIRATEHVYMDAQLLAESTSVEHHVDHIIPLRGKIVSGLHWHENLIPITGAMNLEKSNAYEVFSWRAAYPGDTSYLTAQYDQAVKQHGDWKLNSHPDLF